MATKQGKTITFTTAASSFNKGVIVQAMGGVILSAVYCHPSCTEKDYKAWGQVEKRNLGSCNG